MKQCRSWHTALTSICFWTTCFLLWICMIRSLSMSLAGIVTSGMRAAASPVVSQPTKAHHIATETSVPKTVNHILDRRIISMCLCMIDKRYKAGSTVIREAWKYFNVNPDGKITAYRNFFQFEKGMWLQADSLVVKMADPVWPRESPFRSWIERGKPTYISGFHAFATETLAQRASQGWY